VQGYLVFPIERVTKVPLVTNEKGYLVFAEDFPKLFDKWVAADRVGQFGQQKMDEIGRFVQLKKWCLKNNV
jgi:hypothetical protein